MSEQFIAVNNCDYCENSIAPENKFCASCGYPLQGTEQDKNVFVAEMNIQKVNVSEAEKKIKSATTSLYVLAGIHFIFGLIMYFSTNSIEYLIVAIIMPILYGILGLWSKKKPLGAIISGLILYVTLITFDAFEDPSTLFKGIILKGFIIAYLIKGVKGAYEAEQLKKQYPSIFK